MWKSIHTAASNTYQGIKSFVTVLSDLPRAMINVLDNHSTPLHIAASDGQLDVVRRLVEEEKVSPNVENKWKMTPLHLAAGGGHLEVVRYLVDKNVPVNEQSFHGLTPLHLAILLGHIHVVRYFIDEKNVSCDEKIMDDGTLLHLAAISGQLACVSYFVEEKGMSLNDKTKDGKTVFDFASECEDKAKGQVVLAYLAAIRAKGHDKSFYLNTLKSTVDEVKGQLASNDNHMQEFRDRLLQTVEEKQLALKKEVSLDYQKLRKELEHAVQQEREAQKKRMDALQQEIEKVKAELKDNPQSKELIAKLKELESKQTPLIAAYEAQQAKLAEQMYILTQESMGRFYRVLQGKLHSLFVACEVIESGLVVRNEVGKAEKVVHYLMLAGENIPLPGAQIFTKYLGHILKKNTSKRVDEKLHHIAEQTISFAEIDALTEEVACRLTLIYEEQLLQLDADRAIILAESAMKLILAYLWEGEYTQEEMANQLVQSVARVKTVNENSQGLAKLRQKFKDLSNKFQDTKLTTVSNEQWTAFGVFQRSGVEVKTQDSSLYYSGQGTQPEVYGYRLGSLQEVQIAKMSQDKERVSSRIQAKKMTTSDQKYLYETSKTAKSAQAKVELVGKQNAHTINTVAEMAEEIRSMRLELEKLKSEIDQLKQERSTHNASASSSASHFTLLRQAPHSTKQTSIAKKSMVGVMTEGLTISLDLTSISIDKREKVNALMASYSEHCKEKDILHNEKGKVVALTLPTASLVEKLEEKLSELLKGLQALKKI